MKRAIVGTAGHIDHGKTRLVEALTGTDCDRWEEEKRRGITIDLGFAHLESDDLQIGFVDVPGHERFLDNALAGLGGIRVMLLVVAADEGVKPQTREHLAICSLLDIPCALVALTKADLVDSDTVEIARLEVDELLASTPFAGAEAVAVSSITGEGVAELKRALLQLARRFAADPDPGRPTRLPVDRVFVLKGLGQVVTGTLTAGEIATGETLVAMPGGKNIRIRSVQVHGSDRSKAVAGERTALRITGAEPDDLRRGVQLVEAGAYRESRSLLCRLTLLDEAPSALEGPTTTRVHVATSEVVGRLNPLRGTSIEPGATAIVEIRLARPILIARGDRFVIRRPSPPLTLGGGEVLDPLWSRRRGARLERSLESLGGDDLAAAHLWLGDAGPAGVSAQAIGQRLGVRPSLVEQLLGRLVEQQKAIVVPPRQGHAARWVDPRAFDKIIRRARKVMQEHFGKQRLAESMSKAEAMERILPRKAAQLADVYFEWLAREKVLVIERGRVSVPGRTAEMSQEESRLTRQLLALFDRAALEPPSPTELRRATDAKPQIVDGILEYLRQTKKIVQLPGGLLIAASAIEKVRRELSGSGAVEFSVGDFKRRFGLSRKWAIPLLEHLDSIGYTRRVGNNRQLVGTARKEI